MNKTEFETLLLNRSEEIYQNKKRDLLGLIRDFLHQNKEMNAHESGSSLSWELDQMINKRIEERKSEIISKIQKNEMNRILNNLESVKFLFESELKNE